MNTNIKIIQEKINTVKNINLHNHRRLVKILIFLTEKYPYNKIKKNDYEIHHIVPRSWGGSNLKDNLINIPYKFHFVLHKLLFKAFPSDISMAYAYYMMANCNRKWIDEKQSIKSSKEYSLLKYMVSENAKAEFRDGIRISYRKNKVLAKNIITDEIKLIDKNIFYSSEEWVGLSKGKTISNDQKSKISAYNKTHIKSDKQKASATVMMNNLCKNTIICECCGRAFNHGNYYHHKFGSPTKGLKYSDESKRKISEKRKYSIKSTGSLRKIIVFSINNEKFISYDMKKTISKIGISLPTFRKRFQPKQVGIHRNRNILKLIDGFDINSFKIYEDI